MVKYFASSLGIVIIWSTLAVPGAHAQTEAATSPSPSTRGATQALAELEKNQAEIEAKKAEITALDEKILDLKSRRDSTEAQATLIDEQLQRLERQLERAELELAHTEIALRATAAEKQQNERAVEDITVALGLIRNELRSVIRELYEREQHSFVRILLSTGSFSEALSSRAAYLRLQERQSDLLVDLRTQEEELRQRHEALAEQEKTLGSMQELLAIQQEQLDSQQQEQEHFLQATRAQQVEYEAKLTEARQARQEIEQDIFTLKGTNVQLTFTEATDIARYAGTLTGIRPALLLGVLKIETNLGTNLGSGTFPDDMMPSQREAFLRITKKLGLDPATAPISARPRSLQGWGGAIGPGQFMPTTWEGVEPRVAQLLKKELPNPYELTDAFVATAVFLADRGAADRAKEYEAVNRYLAGPNWQRFTWYGDRVLAVAAEYEKEGL